MSQIIRIGKSFAYAFWILFLVMGVYVFDGFLSQKHNPNQSPDTYAVGNEQVLVLKQNRMGHYVASGFINNYPVTFLLDTGATNVAIPKHVADAIGLPYGAPFRANTANGIATGYRTEIDSLAISDFQFGRVSASILPGMKDDEILLGMSALKRVEFTQRGDTLTLKSMF